MTLPLIQNLQLHAIATLRIAADAGLVFALIRGHELVAVASGWEYLPVPSADVVAIQWRGDGWYLVEG